MNRPEFELIDWIRGRVRDRTPVVLGIGDDAAILSHLAGSESLVAIDMLMEGVHFTFPEATPQQAGRKALAVNLSDIAAMGGRPQSAFVSVALPNSRGPSFAREFHEGLLELADEFHVVIAGGDTNSWNGPLVVSVTVVGEPIGPHPVRRTGASSGDLIFVTGAVGGSLLSGRHLTFPPRVAEARDLISIEPPTAMIDISDGLAADLHHLLRDKPLHAILYADKIPLTAAAQLAADGRDPLKHGLGDGEDFELLFTLPPDRATRLLAKWSHPTPITCIGRFADADEQGCASDGTCTLEYPGGRREPLPSIGWTHSLGTGV